MKLLILNHIVALFPPKITPFSRPIGVRATPWQRRPLTEQASLPATVATVRSSAVAGAAALARALLPIVSAVDHSIRRSVRVVVTFRIDCITWGGGI